MNFIFSEILSLLINLKKNYIEPEIYTVIFHAYATK